MKRREVDMVNGPLLPNIIVYTIPIILTTVLQLLFNAADLVVVGRYCGHLSVAAVSSTTAVTNLIINCFMGLSGGTGITLSHALGRGQDDEVHRIVHTSLPVALLGGAVFSVIGFFCSEPLLYLMKSPENVLPLSALYMRIYFTGLIFTSVYNFSASILRAAGDSRTPLLILLLAGGINVVLNLFFVTAFHMNVGGVALATVISQGISAVLTVIALIRRTDACHLELRQLRFYKKPLLKIIRFGLPAGIQNSLFSISNTTVQSALNSFENGALLSGNGASASLEGFIHAITMSFHQAAANFVGQNHGAGRYDRIRKIFLICLGYVSLITLSIAIPVFLFGEQLLSIYITDSQEALRYGLLRMGFTCIPYVLFGLMDVATGSLRGIGATFLSMCLSVLGICGIRIAWVYTIFQNPQFHTVETLYIAYPISWGLTFLVQSIAFITLVRKRMRQDLTAYPSK